MRGSSGWVSVLRVLRFPRVKVMLILGCQPGGAAPVSSSALPIRGQVKIEGGVAEYPVPRALETDEVAQACSLHS